MIEQQAKVNVKKTNIWTPLHLAAQNDHLDIVKFLANSEQR